MWLKIILRSLWAYLALSAFSILPTALAGSDRLRSEIESCMATKMSVDFASLGSSSLASFYFPDNVSPRVVATVLAESIMYNSHDDGKFAIGVGGTISPAILAEGLRIFLTKSADDVHYPKPKWPGVTLVFYTHHALVKEVQLIAEKHDMKFVSHGLDGRTKAALIGSGCE